LGRIQQSPHIPNQPLVAADVRQQLFLDIDHQHGCIAPRHQFRATGQASGVCTTILGFHDPFSPLAMVVVLILKIGKEITVGFV
jgi:hypothetical protein